MGKKDIELTAYCGLYCLDCIPSDRGLFVTARELQNHLKKRQFEEYARLKSETNKLFESYSRFSEVLQEIINQECVAPCRKGGSNPVCPVRDCARSKKYEGCWECSDWKSCELLTRLKKIHPDLENRLQIIPKESLQSWAIKRKRHYFWQQI
jgi:hypothetical protein